jgi:Protein of unknown function (DUF3102)
MTTLSQGAPSPIASVEVSQTASLQEAATRIRNLSGKVSVSILEIGQVLLQVKAMTAHGSFTQWVEDDCGLTRRSAQNYMRVAIFAADKSASIALLSPTVLYRLAAKSTPAEIVSAVLRLLEGGLIPTESQVAQLFASAPNRSAAFPEPEIGNPSLMASELLLSVGPARAQDLLGSWKLVGAHLRHQLEQQPSDRTPTTQAASEPDLGPGVDLVRDPINEDCFRVKADGRDQGETALHDGPADIVCHPAQPIVSQDMSQTDEPKATDEAVRNASDAVRPDFTDSEGPLHGIPNFLRRNKGA